MIIPNQSGIENEIRDRVTVARKSEREKVLKILNKFVEDNKHTPLSKKSGTTMNDDEFSGYAVGRYAFGEQIQLMIEELRKRGE
jgi:queuine/archaeosine tRNA-ribosyltransferase